MDLRYKSLHTPEAQVQWDEMRAGSFLKYIFGHLHPIQIILASVGCHNFLSGVAVVIQYETNL